MEASRHKPLDTFPSSDLRLRCSLSSRLKMSLPKVADKEKKEACHQCCVNCDHEIDNAQPHGLIHIYLCFLE